MKIAITGSTSNLANIVLQSIKYEFSAEIHSFGRSHHALSDFEYEWSLGQSLISLSSDFDFFLHFAYERKLSRLDLNVNLLAIDSIFNTISKSTVFVCPASYSSDEFGLSLYSLVKHAQEKRFAEKNALNLRIGYLIPDTESFMKRFLYWYSKSRIVILPSKKLKPVYFSSKEEIQKSLINLIRTKESQECGKAIQNPFIEILNRYERKSRIVIRIPRSISYIGARFLQKVSPRPIRQIADSILSLH